jgi:hypothetical protein
MGQTTLLGKRMYPGTQSGKPDLNGAFGRGMGVVGACINLECANLGMAASARHVKIAVHTWLQGLRILEGETVDIEDSRCIARSFSWPDHQCMTGHPV